MSSKVSGFATFVRLIGRSIGGIIMKRIKNKSLFVTALLGTFLLSACQEEAPVRASNDSNSSVSQNSSDTSASTSASLGGQLAHDRERDNGVIVIKQFFESIPLEGLTFKVDSLNEEFTFKSHELYNKDLSKRVLVSVDSLFLADANKDGYDDFFYTCSSRMMKEAGHFIVVYDYHNNVVLFRLDEPNVFNYELLFANHQILVNQYTDDYYDSDNSYEVGRHVGEGLLDYSEREIAVKWRNFLNIDSIDLRVTTADASRTPMELKRGQEADTFVIEHLRPECAYCISTNAVRNSGYYNDLPEDLPVGYRMGGFCRLIQSVSNNRKDNVIVGIDAEAFRSSGNTDAELEISVSGRVYKIIFEFENLDYSTDTHTLKAALGWDFSKENLTRYSHEYIPGDADEHDYPFMYVSVARSGDATKASYNLLEGIVAEIDPTLVRVDVQMEHYNFKASGQTYTFDGYGPYLKYGEDYYLVLYSKDYSYANSNSEGYYRFRDHRTEVRVRRMAHTDSGFFVGETVITNATAILFERYTLSSSGKTSNDIKSEYTLEIAGNSFYIMDAKTMDKGNDRYRVVSEHDFSSLFAK